MQHRDKVCEAMRRCKYKFPGRQQIVVDNKWGFTEFTHPQYKALQEQGMMYNQGVHAKIVRPHGPINDKSILIF